MKTLLRIDASIRKKGSYSRDIGDFFQSQWEIKNPEGRIINRDLAEQNVPHINQRLTEAFYWEGNTHEILSLSDQIIKEVMACDTLLITSALYNFSLPSSLKSYIDHLVRINKTFSQGSDGRYLGLMKNKQAIIVTSKGGIYKGTNYGHLDFQDPYLKAVLNFIGIQMIEVFSIEGTKDVKYAENSLSTIKSHILNFLVKDVNPTFSN